MKYEFRLGKFWVKFTVKKVLQKELQGSTFIGKVRDLRISCKTQETGTVNETNPISLNTNRGKDLILEKFPSCIKTHS